MQKEKEKRINQGKKNMKKREKKAFLSHQPS